MLRKLPWKTFIGGIALSFLLIFFICGKRENALDEFRQFTKDVCACDSLECVYDVQEAGSKNPLFLEEDGDDPMVMAKRYGKKYLQLDEKFEKCLDRFSRTGTKEKKLDRFETDGGSR